MIKGVFLLWDFPNKKEGFSNILVGRASITVDRLMNERSDFVDKDENLLLKNLSYFGKVSDVAKSKDCTFFFTLNHGVHVSLLNDVGSYNLCSSASEDCWQQSSNLDNGVADDSRLQLDVSV